MKKMRKEMGDSEILAILDNQFNNSIGGYNSSSDDSQADALDYYYGKPYGNELEGRSQIVTRDTLETIEWIMPSLLRVFASGSKVVKFDPVSLMDEPQAEQETDVVNHIFNKLNNGFLTQHHWFKDALLSKNSYLKVYVAEEERTEVETYSGLGDLEFTQVVNRENIEPIAHTERQIEVMTPQGPMIETVHDIKIRVTEADRKIKYAVIPAEEIRVGRGHTELSVKEASYVCHESIKTATDLFNMGIGQKVIDQLPRDTGLYDTQVDQARNNNDDDNYKEEADRSMKPIRVREHYIYIDQDGDGKAELRKILTAGNTILDNEEWDFIPIACLSPIMMPHEHQGLSEADLVMDLQLIRSVLLRQMLDNLYLTNNPEKEVLEDEVNLDDLLESLPGGLKRVTQMGSIRELTVPFTAGQSMPMLEILDSMRESRTGVSRHTMGLDANTLAQSTKGAFMGALEQANQRIEMLARVFAETGIKEIFQMTHELCIKNIDKPMIVKLRDQYVPIDPSEWKHRSTMTVTVGLGTGNKDQLSQRLWALAEKQEQHLQMKSPLVTPKNLYNTYEKIIEAADLKEVGLYFTDPEMMQQQPQQQPPQPNPLAEAEKIKGEYKLKSDQMNAQLKAQLKQMEEMNKQQINQLKEQSKHEMALMKLQLENSQAEADRLSREAIEKAKLEVMAYLQDRPVDIGEPGIGAEL